MIKKLTLTYTAVILVPVVFFITDEVLNLQMAEFVPVTFITLTILLCGLYLGFITHKLTTRDRLKTTHLKTSQKAGTTLLSLLALFILFIIEAGLLFGLGMSTASGESTSLSLLITTSLLPIISIFIIVIQLAILRLPKTP